MTYPLDGEPGVVAVGVEGADPPERRPLFLIVLTVVVLAYLFTAVHKIK